jgi:exopolyphosphatase / guanosine-5'-triphosphate,3'-diphosphate pyrophosphatase
VLRQPGIGLDHYARAFLAMTIALRYEADIEAPFLNQAKALLDISAVARAEVLGVALRLAYTLSAGTRDLLAGTWLRIEGGVLSLVLREDTGVVVGESVIRRLDRLAQVLGLTAMAEADTDTLDAAAHAAG